MNASKRVDKSVFISYRRTNRVHALAISQYLTQHGFDVFLDFEGIGSGDFEQVILENIRARAHFLVVLTPSALNRCDDPKDWLRWEIEAAIDNRRNIVPIMFKGFDFSNPKIARLLTGKLDLLKKYNAIVVPAEYFEEAMDRLRETYLNVTLDAVLHPASSTALQFAKEQKATASKAPVVQENELAAEAWREGILSWVVLKWVVLPGPQGKASLFIRSMIFAFLVVGSVGVLAVGLITGIFYLLVAIFG